MKAKLAGQFFKRVIKILDIEKIKYEENVVAEVINKYFPDWRRVLNELQRYSVNGSIDSGILTNFQDLSIKEIFGFCKTKDYDSIRKWISENSDQDSSAIFESVYNNAEQYMQKRSIPELIVILSDYQYKAAFVANHEINMLAFFVEIMMRCEWL